MTIPFRKEPLVLDASEEDADWIKGGTWDLPPYYSKEFFAAIGGIDALEDFKKSVTYKSAVEKGLIHDDEWMGDDMGYGDGA